MELPRSNYVAPRRVPLDHFPQAVTGALIGASTLGGTAAVGAPLQSPVLVDGPPPDDDGHVEWSAFVAKLFDNRVRESSRTTEERQRAEQDLWRLYYDATGIELAPHAFQPAHATTLQIPGRFAPFVRHGADPGNYYCEHAFFVAQTLAHAEGSVIAKNAHGERLVGFLHVPRDPWTGTNANHEYLQSERHERTRDIVGAAIHGYFEAASETLAPDEPFRMLLTGYGEFGSTRDNPTESFLLHPENLDAAMQLGFGTALLQTSGQSLQETSEGPLNEYTVVHEGEERRIQLHTQVLTVSDEALDPNVPASIPAAFIDGRPHAILSMGVRSVALYEAEFHADDGGLVWGGDTPTAHDGSVQPTRSLPPNYSLARALGAQ